MLNLNQFAKVYCLAISWFLEKKIKQPHWYIDAEINDRNLFKNKMSDY